MATLAPVDFDPFKRDPFDAALAAEGVKGPIADIARSIYQQESSSGKNTKTSNAGAVGGMQVIPGTFKSVADEGWDINDPIHNSRAGIRYLKQLYKQADGDPALTAAGYYGGPGGLEKARRGVAVSDPRNPNAPTTLQYGEQVAARLSKTPLSPIMATGKAITDAVVPSANAAEAGPRLVPVDFDPFATAKPEAPKGAMDAVMDAVETSRGAVQDFGKGLARGAASIGDTITNAASVPVVPSGPNRLINPDTQAPAVEARNAERQAGLAAYDAEAPNSVAYGAGKLTSEIAGTAGIGGALAAPIKAAGVLPRFASALHSGGLTIGSAPAATMAQGAGNLLARVAGGAASGGAMTSLVDPDSAATGAAIGAALPVAARGLGMLGSGLARVGRGPEVPQGIQQAAAAGREAGYVIPPTQARPTLGNRLIEGFSGKITTAQNASARNQEVTNRLAQQAIGAPELSPAGLQAVRANANAAYDALGRAGKFQADESFKTALDKVGASTRQLKADFPEVVNKDVDALVEGFSSKSEFDAQSAIEAIKRLRASSNANKAAFSDPERQALGRVQSKVSAALEDLIDRNLAKQGSSDLLTAYRDARQTLAKVYDVERALNPATGNVDAKKIGNLLKKGKLTGDLKTIGEFSSSFPKAAQNLEGMGSLPQTSPLDWHALAATSIATGNPLPMLGVVARPAARRLSLSPVVQNRLAQPPMGISASGARNLLAPAVRSGPLLGSDQ